MHASKMPVAFHDFNVRIPPFNIIKNARIFIYFWNYISLLNGIIH
jgi:hypothetical protein